MNFKKIPIKNKQVQFKYLDGETFLLLLESGRFFKFDRVGTDAWKLVNGKRSIGEIISLLQDVYSVDRVKLTEDLTSFIEKGVKLSIIYFKR